MEAERLRARRSSPRWNATRPRSTAPAGTAARGMTPFERGVIERAGFLCQQVHEAERALLGHVQRDERSVRLQRLLADVERIRQVFHVAGAAVQIDHVIGVVLELGLLDRAERDHVDAALLRDRAHVARGLDALDAARSRSCSRTGRCRSRRRAHACRKCRRAPFWNRRSSLWNRFSLVMNHASYCAA